MRDLSFGECTQVSGAIDPQLVIIGLGAVSGGYIGYKMTDFFSPLATLFCTIGGAIALGVICTPAAPPLGTIVGGSAGALMGYLLGASFANVGGFLAGGCLGAYAASRLIPG